MPLQADAFESDEGWLSIWSWPCPNFPNASVILLQASNEMASAMNVQAPFRCPRCLFAAVEKMPWFTGMVYVMRDSEDLSVLKVGAAKDAVARMKRSPWRKELGKVSHLNRSEELVLACVNIPSSRVESHLHIALGPPALEKGRGREWFLSDLKTFSLIFRDLARNEGRMVWIRHDATSCAETQNFRSVVHSCTGDLADTFARGGEITCVYRKPNGFDVVSSIWCPVQYNIDEHDIAMPFYAPPDNCRHPSLAAELRAFNVDACDAEPDVIRDGDAWRSGSSCQRLHRIRRVGSVVPGHDPLLDVTRSEWEVAGEIYEIDYRTKVDVLERFRPDGMGELQREGCQQIF